MFKEINLRNHSSLHKLFYSLDCVSVDASTLLENVSKVVPTNLTNDNETSFLEIDFIFIHP